MPAPSTILARPEFAVLRHLSRVNLYELAFATQPGLLPKLRSFGGRGFDDPLVDAFWRWRWDGRWSSRKRQELADALNAALTEKEGGDARP